MKPKILLLGATRMTGKDTLCQRLMELNPRFKRFSYADELKNDLSSFVADRFGFSIWNCSPEEKELIRPLMIAYGMAQRSRDPDYWAKRTQENIENYLAYHPQCIPVVTDVRFSNELVLMRRDYDATFLFLERKGAPPPTEEEEKHWPTLKEQADFVLEWGNNSVEEQRDIAKRLLKQILLV